MLQSIASNKSVHELASLMPDILMLDEGDDPFAVFGDDDFSEHLIVAESTGNGPSNDTESSASQYQVRVVAQDDVPTPSAPTSSVAMTNASTTMKEDLGLCDHHEFSTHSKITIGASSDPVTDRSASTAEPKRKHWSEIEPELAKVEVPVVPSLPGSNWTDFEWSAFYSLHWEEQQRIQEEAWVNYERNMAGWQLHWNTSGLKQARTPGSM
jgi:hypothetical protein